MPRAYAARLSTTHLIGELRAIGVERVLVIPPHRTPNGRSRTKLRLFSGKDGWGQDIYSDFTIPEARAFLAHEKENR